MAIRKRNGSYHLDFRPFKDKKIGLRLDVSTKAEARQVEAMLLRACRSGDYRNLDSAAREAAIRMFSNQEWRLPPELSGDTRPIEELTVWKACEIFLTYPDIRSAPGRWRHECSVAHLVEKLGKSTPLKSLWIPALKTYQQSRLAEGAAADTINRELSTLSRLFGVMIELQLVDNNPAKLVKRLSAKSGERQAYVSMADVERIAAHCPAWFRSVIWTAYYTGMRRGEILELTRNQVKLSRRLIQLGPEDTKEGHWKRVPIRLELIPILDDALRVTALGCENVFLLKDGKGVRPLELESSKNPWPRACKALDLPKPWPRYHDLRHTWKTNARRSGMDSELREAILGHAERGKSVVERYGRISDAELINAVDGMTFDHGPTEILVADRPNRKKGDWMATEGVPKKKGHGAS